MQASYSRINTFKQCSYKYKLHYINKLKVINDPAPDNALIVGNSIHLGIETNTTQMLNHYLEGYRLIDDLQVNECIKLEFLAELARKRINSFEILHQEYLIETPEFKGIVDLITLNPDGTVNVYDFKYSNNIDNYLESGQLHVYKYFLEKQGFQVDKLGFIFIPKTGIRQKKTEDLYQFRKRLREILKTLEIKIVEIPYDESKVLEFLDDCNKAASATEFSKNQSKLCDWCEYQKYCMEGIDYMILPENVRREVKINTTPDLWLYGDSYSGKTTHADSYNNVLMLNTDGNIDNITSPVIRIMDTLKIEGRLTTRIYAWENFLEVLSELEKKDNCYETIVVDLVEDLFEHCRLYMYNKLSIEHEQDAGFGKGWDMIRTEFLSNMKRLKNCGYRIIYISKVAVSEVTKKNGDKITTYKPNINDKIANVLSGTVDITARVIADGDERYLSFKTSPYIFGGSRYNFGVDEIELNKDVFIETLKKAQGNNEGRSKRNDKVVEEGKTKKDQPEAQNELSTDSDRTGTNINKDTTVTNPDADATITEDKPKRTRKSRKDA